MPSARHQPAGETDRHTRFRRGLAESHRCEGTAFITLNTALEEYLAHSDVKGAAAAPCRRKGM